MSRGLTPITLDSKKLKYGPGTFFAGFPSSLGFVDGGESYSNFLASTGYLSTVKIPTSEPGTSLQGPELIPQKPSVTLGMPAAL